MSSSKLSLKLNVDQRSHEELQLLKSKLD